jgi:hypothetical protein
LTALSAKAADFVEAQQGQAQRSPDCVAMDFEHAPDSSAYQQ